MQRVTLENSFPGLEKTLTRSGLGNAKTAHGLPLSVLSATTSITNQSLHPLLLGPEGLRILLSTAAQEAPLQSERAPRLAARPILGPAPPPALQRGEDPRAERMGTWALGSDRPESVPPHIPCDLGQDKAPF